MDIITKIDNVLSIDKKYVGILGNSDLMYNLMKIHDKIIVDPCTQRDLLLMGIYGEYRGCKKIIIRSEIPSGLIIPLTEEKLKQLCGLRYGYKTDEHIWIEYLIQEGFNDEADELIMKKVLI